MVEAVGNHGGDAHVGAANLRHHRLGALGKRQIESAGDERLAEQRAAVDVNHLDVESVFLKNAGAFAISRT